MGTYYLGAYWGDRKESVSDCAVRLATCLAGLGEAAEVLGRWYRKGRSKATANVPVGLDVESLTELLARGRSRRDFGGEVIEDLGFSVGMWNRTEPTVGLMAGVGMYPEHPGILNAFVLNLPTQLEAGVLYQPEVAAAMLDAVVRAWDPDWSTLSSSTLRELQGDGDREPVVGWMTYLSTPVDVEPPGVTLRPLLAGTVLTIGDDISCADDSAVVNLKAFLVENGLVRPTPQQWRPKP